MKLNIGSGYTRYKDFLNVDMDAKCNPDFLFDIENDTWPFEDNSVEFVIAHHILEHIGEGYFHFIKELYRICKPNAVIDIKVPHHRHDSFATDPSHKRPILEDSFYMFSKKYNDFIIESDSPISTLAHQLDVDFEMFEVQEVMEEYYADLLKDESEEYIKRFVKERNNVIIEIGVKLLVIK